MILQLDLHLEVMDQILMLCLWWRSSSTTMNGLTETWNGTNTEVNDFNTVRKQVGGLGTIIQQH